MPCHCKAGVELPGGGCFPMQLQQSIMQGGQHFVEAMAASSVSRRHEPVQQKAQLFWTSANHAPQAGSTGRKPIEIQVMWQEELIPGPGSRCKFGSWAAAEAPTPGLSGHTCVAGGTSTAQKGRSFASFLLQICISSAMPNHKLAAAKLESGARALVRICLPGSVIHTVSRSQIAACNCKLQGPTNMLS